MPEWIKERYMNYPFLVDDCNLGRVLGPGRDDDLYRVTEIIPTETGSTLVLAILDIGEEFV